MKHEQQRIAVVLDFLAHEQSTLDKIKTLAKKIVCDTISGLDFPDGVNLSVVEISDPLPVLQSGIRPQI